MDYWFSEHHTENVKFSVKVDKHLFTNETDLGRVDIFESPEFGKFLAVDGYIIFTEKDEFIYDEMLSHVPMAVNPKAKSVLVFGSGDGGVVEEFLKYDTIERIDLVEVNEGVIEACRLYFPETSGCLDDPRVTTYTENALRFIRHIDRDYDIIVVDSAGFYRGLHRPLRPLRGAVYQGVLRQLLQGPQRRRNNGEPAPEPVL